MPIQGPVLRQKAEEITLKLNIEFTPLVLLIQETCRDYL
jgi:hypothetical protein